MITHGPSYICPRCESTETTVYNRETMSDGRGNQTGEIAHRYCKDCDSRYETVLEMPDKHKP